ncbi:vacuolar iron transporter 1-like [Rhodamnia argentea]|uniref:Vacuolar iron transporter n=1 Tax=Rhodamnia argentea TaxID=178133 RepID=A0A8B8MTD7_9MYRT|nr:vacuolar iron transporter 1-like [Rhodamnia argentea]
MAENGNVDREKQRLLLQDHEEKHFMSSEVVRDIIIGVSDGLTVPFALAAGLSGAQVKSGIILIAGIAEVVAGAISMGLGGYLAAKSEADHYARELKREQEEIVDVPDIEAAEIAEILSQYGVEPHEYEPVVNSLRRNPQAWLDFMMKFELGLEEPDPLRALWSAATIAFSYVAGGMVPLSPYVILPIAQDALIASIVVTITALLVFGFVKGYFTGNRPFKSAFQTALISAVASAAAFGIAKLFRA